MEFVKIFVIMLSFILVSAAASASMIIPSSESAKEHSEAPENSPVIGEGWDLERVDFIHYAKPVSPGKPPKTDSCYKLMGVKWKTLPASYIVNPSNFQGLNESFITSAVYDSAETWDASTTSELFNDSYSVDYYTHYGTYDGKNVVEFAAYPDNNVIAVTSVWYIRSGKQIVEFDMLFNTHYSWGDASLNPLLMDVQNIATHELGHAVGLSDIYSTSCSAVTMYGYSQYGEASKRSLEPADIAGLQMMYG